MEVGAITHFPYQGNKDVLHQFLVEMQTFHWVHVQLGKKDYRQIVGC